jgi:hypothetical protein
MIFPLISSCSILVHFTPIDSRTSLSFRIKVDLPRPGMPRGMMTRVVLGESLIKLRSSFIFS